MVGTREVGGGYPSPTGGLPVLKLSLAGVRANRARFASLTFAIFIGVLFIAATLTITDTVQSGFNSLFANAYRNVSVAVREKSEVTRQQQTFRGRIDAEVAATVRKVPGVAAAVPLIEGYAYVVSADGRAPANVVSDTAGAPIAQNWLADGELNPFDLVEGTAPTASGDVVIDRATAIDSAIAVGDRVTVVSKTGSTPARVVGIVRFGSVDSPGGVPVALFDDADATRLLGEVGRIDAVMVRGDPTGDDAQLAAAVQRVLPEGIEAVTGRTAARENENAVRSNLRFFTAFLLIFAVLALVVGAFIIANTFAMSISQRTRDLALLRAVGATRSQIRRMVLGEAFVMSVAGTLLGLVGGIALASGLRSFLRATGVDLPPSPLTIRAPTVLWSLGVGIVVTFLAALVPAIHASRIAPVAAMRDNEIEHEPLWIRTTLGAVLATAGAVVMRSGANDANLARTGGAIAVLFLGVLMLAPAFSLSARVLVSPLRRMFGLTAGLAARNTTRNPRRTASTALALSLGSAVACFAVILNASLQQSLTTAIAGGLRGDLVVRSASFGVGGLPISLADRISALPGVEAASGLRYGFATVDGPKRKPRKASAVSRTGGRPIASIDPTTADRLLDFGTEVGRFSDLGRGTIALSERELDDHGWKVGDTLRLGFPGKPPVPFTVSTVYRQGIAFDFAIGHTDYEKYVSDPFDFVVYVAARDGSDIETLRARIQSLVADYPTAKVENPSEYVARLTNSLDQLLSLIVGLLVLVVVVAVIGIAITLSLSVVERVREIGLLRTLGMQPGQVRAMLRTEAIVISLFAVAIGVGLGTGGAWALLRALRGEGLTSFVFPAVSVGLLGLLAAFAGLVASVIPGRRAARLPVLSALTGSHRLAKPRYSAMTSQSKSRRRGRIAGAVAIATVVVAVGVGLANRRTPSRPVAVEVLTTTTSGPAPSSPTTSVSSADSDANAPYAIPVPDTPLVAGGLVSATTITAPTGLRGWRVLFGSTLRTGETVVVSGLVFVPDRAAPAGGWPVLSFAHPTTGLADRCAPSRNVGILESTVAAFGGQLSTAVVISDYPGLGTPGDHPFLDGVSSGRSVLDIVRAAGRIEGLAFSRSTVIWGHSQGGHAALFAAEEAPTYAPGLDVRGVVAGAPPSQLTSLVSRIAATPDRGYLVLVAKGLAATDPTLSPADVLTPAGLAAAKRLDTECSDAVIGDVRRDTLEKDGPLPAAWIRALDADEPGRTRITAPVLIIQGGADTLVPPETSATLESELRALGTDVERKLYPDATHGGVVLGSLSDVISWIAERQAAG